MTSRHSWDAQVAVTQRLMYALSQCRQLECLQLRMATNHTPRPYAHRDLTFYSYQNLRCLRLIQVDNASILRSLGCMLSVDPQLCDLALWADPDAALSLESFLLELPEHHRFSLSSLDLRGFVALYPQPALFWSIFSAASLTDLTLHVHPLLDDHSRHDFWTSARAEPLRLTRVNTNAICANLVTFLHESAGLEVARFDPAGCLQLAQTLQRLIVAVLQGHAKTLRVLSVDPWTEGSVMQHLDTRLLAFIAAHGLRLKELAVGLQLEHLVGFPYPLPVTSISDLVLVKWIDLLMPWFVGRTTALRGLHYADTQSRHLPYSATRYEDGAAPSTCLDAEAFRRPQCRRWEAAQVPCS